MVKKTEKEAQKYLFAYACTSCRKAFKRPVLGQDFEADRIKKCPHCGAKAYNLGRRFKAPKMTDDKGWALVAFMIDNGFFFNAAYVKAESGPGLVHVPYPKTLREAQEFVEKYKDCAICVKE